MKANIGHGSDMRDLVYKTWEKTQERNPFGQKPVRKYDGTNPDAVRRAIGDSRYLMSLRN